MYQVMHVILFSSYQSFSIFFRFRDIEISENGVKKPSFSALKRQNPFIQLLTEGKKLRENNKCTQTAGTLTSGNAIVIEKIFNFFMKWLPFENIFH